MISIHAPREGSDEIWLHEGLTMQISIHAPREGSDPDGGDAAAIAGQFQSTLPVRGATGGQAVE